MKFSIIIPVYNVEDYIKKCLESVYNQTYVNYEVIIVDDGSPDNSKNIIKEFIKDKKNFKYFYKDNGGLSDARNYGLKQVKGDYILFLDSDDYLSCDLLNELIKEIRKNAVDVIRYSLNYVQDKIVIPASTYSFSNYSLDEALDILLKDKLLEPTWLYCYKKTFWNKYNFRFNKGRIHEDFGLTPLILMNAKSISSIDYLGYNYVLRENSIMTSLDAEKMRKKFDDTLYFYENNIKLIEKNLSISNKAKVLLKSYYANGLISRAKLLKGKNLKYAIMEIKNRKAYKYLIDDTLGRKIKKYIIKFFPKMYVKGIK